MEVTSHDDSNVTIVSVSGSIDGFTSDDLLEALQVHIDSGARAIVVDLGGVDFISSAGLRAILLAQKQIRQDDGDLRLSNSRERVLKVLKLSGYTSIFKIFDDTPTAIASFGA